MSDDYGFYGKGLDGYVHYKQAFDESQKGSSGGGPKKGNNNNNNGGKGCAIAVGFIIFLAYLIIKAIF